MKLEIFGVGLKVGPQLEKRIRRKMEKFDKYFDETASCQVKCSKDGQDLRKVEITIYVKKHILRAEKTDEDILTALDSAIAALEGQIRKQKSKLKKRKKDYAYLEDFFLEEADVEAELEPESQAGDLNGATFRFKTFPLSPMNHEEAALQMELMGHDFFLYLDGETGKVNLVYKRRDGNYGVLDPDY
jgi:putative sigma-54 modulation protein